jgi:hypothetical protein
MSEDFSRRDLLKCSGFFLGAEGREFQDCYCAESVFAELPVHQVSDLVH